MSVELKRNETAKTKSSALLLIKIRRSICERLVKSFNHSSFHFARRRKEIFFVPIAYDIIRLTAMSSNITNTTHLGAHFLPKIATAPLESAKCSYEPKFRFSEQQLRKYPKTQQLKIAVAEKIEKKEYFYGIEILARNHNPKLMLDYTKFGKMLPLFTSLVWLGLDYSRVTNVEEVESIRVAKKLKDNQHEMLIAPHLSCYGLDTKRLKEFTELNFTNIVIVRGDQYDNEQEFKYASQLVAQIRRECQDSITIAVAGHPEGHPNISTMQEDMKFLIEKINGGADLIITQVCFKAQALIDFIKSCRLHSINIPIILGIYVPDNIKSLQFLMELTKIEMSEEDLQEYRYYASKGTAEFRFFAAQKVTQMILTVLNTKDINIYGIHFFTMNKFGMVTKVLEELRKYIKI